jgi:glycosyltransferase involved in cell wall biosynthesis
MTDDEHGAARARLSVIVITRDEAQRLPTCLKSVAFADEIVVVDSASSDGTPDVARRLGARVIETGDWPGFGPQKQRALSAATGDWVFSIDADEWVDDALAAGIRDVVAGRLPAAGAVGPVDGWQVDRLSAFCGQWMRAGSWHPDRLPRLFRRGSAHFSDDQVHERLLIDTPARGARDLPVLPGLLLHNSIASLHDGLEKMNRYTTGRAADLRSQGRRGGLGAALVHGTVAFLRSYVLRRGFLDGRLGLVLAMLDAQSSAVRYLKLWLDARPVGHELPPPDARERRR